MIKSELINVLSKKLPKVGSQNVELSINCILEKITKALENGERIEVSEIDSFMLPYFS